ncbi:MAG: DUF2235 domain-containing protein [Verrucomicrobia bacterium]|nr:DUF2235 domain-containing protein [Verrucomicrobiota bacterium]MBV8279579.1 DUF2235 domain-containing protein [Verrucomicrobiota bacterium]
MSDTPEHRPNLQSAGPMARGRNLVICCDGTSNEFGRRNTNVVRLLQCLKRDTHRQFIYYGPGVGTLPDPNRITRLGKWWSQVIGLAFGHGLTADVMEAYTYLMELWEAGDRVFIFAFSRGAYTARVLAGLLHTFGLMPRGAYNLLPYVIKNYHALSDRTNKDETRNIEQIYQEFRRTFARAVPGDEKERHFPVHFLGVWDTVSTVGWIWDPKSFRHTAYNPSIVYARHAIAIDERRIFFRQNRFSHGEGSHEKSGVGDVDGVPRRIECWFPGSHCDVGGGHAPEDDKLWPLSLDWMLEEAAKVELYVDPDRKRTVFGATASSKVWVEQHHESLEGLWKVAEYFPAVRWRRDYETNTWHRRFEMGKGIPRKIRSGDLIHESTLRRLREKEVDLPDGRKGPYEPRNLCVKYKEEVRRLPEQLPEYHVYQPANCGCQACDGLRKSNPNS